MKPIKLLPKGLFFLFFSLSIIGCEDKTPRFVEPNSERIKMQNHYLIITQEAIYTPHLAPIKKQILHMETDKISIETDEQGRITSILGYDNSKEPYNTDLFDYVTNHVESYGVDKLDPIENGQISYDEEDNISKIAALSSRDTELFARTFHYKDEKLNEIQNTRYGQYVLNTIKIGWKNDFIESYAEEDKYGETVSHTKIDYDNNGRMLKVSYLGGYIMGSRIKIQYHFSKWNQNNDWIQGNFIIDGITISLTRTIEYHL